MEEGLLHPSILQKIQGQPHQFTRNYDKPRVSTPGDFASAKGSLHRLHSVGKYDAGAYSKGSLHCQHPPCEGNTSSAATPMSSVLVEAPYEIPRQPILILMATVSSTAFAPLERVKLLMQCQKESINTVRLFHSYRGIGDCFATTVRNEGIPSLWRGNAADILGFLISKAGYMAAENYLTRLLNQRKDKHNSWQLDMTVYSLAVSASYYLHYPLKYAQTRLATDMISFTFGKVSGRQFNGIIDVCQKTIKTDGIIGLYRGCNIGLFKSLLGDALVMGAKVTIVPQLLAMKDLPSWSGAVVGFGVQTCSHMITYPLDTVNCRMMMRSGEAIKYTSSLHAFSQILQTEGVRSLYKGAPAQVLRNIITLGFVLGYLSLA